LTDLQQLCHPNAFILLVGNKCDREDEWKVGVKQVQEEVYIRVQKSSVRTSQTSPVLEAARECASPIFPASTVHFGLAVP
jgi:GTPase SAR1 family protein